jgi:hypothetical protein
MNMQGCRWVSDVFCSPVVRRAGQKIEKPGSKGDAVCDKGEGFTTHTFVKGHQTAL